MIHFFWLILYQPLYNILIWITSWLPDHSVAWAIIILTLIVRIALLPSSIKAARLQVKNLALQPKINKLKSEIKDQKEQSKALMDLYKEEGVSPFGSCLPMLIQLPILIVLYQVFRGGLTTAHFGDLYSFVPHPTTINTAFLGLDLAKPSLWVLPIIAGILQLGLSFLMTPPKPKAGAVASSDPMAMMSKQMIFLLPVTTVLFGRAMPAALVLYWAITTLFSIGQQLYVNKEFRKEKIENRDEILENRYEKRENRTEQIEDKSEQAPEIIEKPAKSDFMTKLMNKRLDRAERKSGVNVTVRTKKK